jgi:hypothetical protein
MWGAVITQHKIATCRPNQAFGHMNHQPGVVQQVKGKPPMANSAPWKAVEKELPTKEATQLGNCLQPVWCPRRTEEVEVKLHCS